MEVPGLAHNITSPLSPCEGMIKDLSLDAIQLCERDETQRIQSTARHRLSKKASTCRHLVSNLKSQAESYSADITVWSVQT
ncbi:Phytanoyl-CoA hydroxylase-interacting protein-like [Collichthys lucidus]|uniref:Phytanoyl-CoA hydroxylase-interacting protein-like n=1 Tax=Collichthys lucidus TaxID=240159 RepID=A0A4U5VFN3_COLLU|nr:Phytanoyl-CoA hydroxylase-interacting protein-like [Collichthys lucidus]